jgi:glucose-1-phosphate thymidylyltransferase
MDVVAILPAAGAATRLRGAFKELLPLVFERGDDGGLLPVPALAHALRACARAGIRDAVAVVSPAKLELVRTLQDGSELGLSIAWVVQPQPAGLTEAIVRALRWTAGRRVLLVLPDAVIEPGTALRAVIEAPGDVVLGVFPTDRAHELGPVGLDPSDPSRVITVFEKPAGVHPANTWGLVMMSADFCVWLCERVARDPALGAWSIGLHVDAAVREGRDVRAVDFPTGSFRDLGTPRGLADWIANGAASPVGPRAGVAK